MKLGLIKPDKEAVSDALRSCISSAALKEGKCIHSVIIKDSLEQDEGLGSALIDLYVKCGSLQEARNVFDKLKKSFALPWNVMITGYILCGDAHEVLCLFCQMLLDNFRLNHVSFLNVLKACSKLLQLEDGKLVHANIIESGFESHHTVCNTLIDMYLKCGLVDDARRVFERLLFRDVVSWNAMISGLAQRNSLEAFHLFEKMQHEGSKPNSYTYSSILKACCTSEAGHQAKLIHTLVIGDGVESDGITGSSLMDAYAKCGHLEDARKLWDCLSKRDVVAYNSMIAGYAQHGHGEEALNLFVRMREENKRPDEATLLSVLKACACVTSIDQGKSVHSLIIRGGFKIDVDIGTTLMNMYIKFGIIEQAYKIFNNMAQKNIVAWNVIFTGLAQCGLSDEIFELLGQMQEETEPDNITFVSLLKACTSKASLEQGKWVHCHVVESCLDYDDLIGNSLVEMYAKCEDVNGALHVFHRLQKRDVVAWSALIVGYALKGKYEDVADHFDGMQKEGLRPDNVAYVNLLSACNQKGLLKEGLSHFVSMMKDHDIKPKLEHFTCIANLLCRSGRLMDAEVLLESMPFQCNIVGWMSLLNSCRTHGKVEIGRRCFDRIMLIDCNCGAAYTLMSDLYSHMGMLEEAEFIEGMRKYVQAG